MAVESDWATRLRVEVAEVRMEEAKRTRLFEDRAKVLWVSCFEWFKSLEADANAALRSSGLVTSFTRSKYNPLQAWIEVGICELSVDGSPSGTICSLRLSTSDDYTVISTTDIADLPSLNLSNVNDVVIQDILFSVVIAGLRRAVAQP